MRVKKTKRHFSEAPTEASDLEVGRELAGAIGDTYIDFRGMSPESQWATVAKALRLHGLRVSEARAGNRKKTR